MDINKLRAATPALPTAERLAEIHFNLADALDNFIREPVIGSNQYIADVRDLLAELGRLTARVKSQQDELGSQEVQMLRVVKETHRWSAAVKKLEAERVYVPAPAGETDGQPEYGRVDCPSCGNSLAWDEAWALTEGECKYCGYGGTPAK